MALGWSRRRVAAVLVVLVALGAVGGSIAYRVNKRAADEKAGEKARNEIVALEFGGADLAYVERKPLARWLPVSGTLAPERQATVKAKVSGEVREIRVREGESVRAGQVIARFDTADLDAKLIERTGALESAKAQLALADKTRTMNQKLLHERFISQNAYDGSDSSYSVAQGGLKSAEAQVRLAQNALKDAIVVAPLTGVVAKRHVQPGEKVPFDAPLVTVVDLSDLELQALVPAVDVPEIRLGMPVELSIDGFGERRFAGRIGRINPSTEPGTRAIVVYVALPNPDHALRGGMFATGRIALAAGDPAPTLPSTAIRSEAGQAYVWTIEQGKLVRRNVQVGRRDEQAGLVEIRTTLPPTVPVLANRFDNLKDGAPAIVKAPTASTTASGAGTRVN